MLATLCGIAKHNVEKRVFLNREAGFCTPLIDRR